MLSRVKIPNIVTGPRVYNLYISVHCIADKYQTGLDIPEEEDRLCQMQRIVYSCFSKNLFTKQLSQKA